VNDWTNSNSLPQSAFLQAYWYVGMRPFLRVKQLALAAFDC